MRHADSEVENLKALIHNEFTTIRTSIEDLKRKNFITDNIITYSLFERRGGLSEKREYNQNRNYKISY